MFDFLIKNIERHGVWGFIIDLVIIFFFVGILIGILYPIMGSDAKKKRNGEKYESFISRLLYKTFGVMPIRNILLQNFDDETELDMVFVNKKGVFAIECKYHSKKYSPILTGSLNDDIWRVGSNMTMQNPFNQNHKHIKFLEELIGVKYIYSIVYTSCPFNFKFFGMVRDSKKEPLFDMLNSEHKAIIQDNETMFLHRGTKHFFTSVLNLPDIYTDKEVKNICTKLSSMQMNRKERKAYAQRMEIKKMNMR